MMDEVPMGFVLSLKSIHLLSFLLSSGTIQGFIFSLLDSCNYPLWSLCLTSFSLPHLSLPTEDWVNFLNPLVFLTSHRINPLLYVLFSECTMLLPASRPPHPGISLLPFKCAVILQVSHVHEMPSQICPISLYFQAALPIAYLVIWCYNFVFSSCHLIFIINISPEFVSVCKSGP